MLRKNLAKLTRTQRQQLVTELTAEERQFASVGQRSLCAESAYTYRRGGHTTGLT
jgi:hypothetical protein